MSVVETPDTRLAHLTATLEKEQARLEEVTLELAQLDVDEADARDKALAASPTWVSSGDTEVAKIARKREKLIRVEAALRADMDARKRAIAACNEAVVKARAIEAYERVLEFRSREEAAYRELGAAFDQFAETWLEKVVPVIEEHTRFVAELEEVGNAWIVRTLDEMGWDRNTWVYSIPQDIRTAFKKLLFAADPTSSNHDIGAMSDYRHVLPECVTERPRLSVYTIPKAGNFEWNTEVGLIPFGIDKPSWNQGS